MNTSYSQETSKTKDIDIIVNNINHLNYQTTRDSVFQDKPEYGLKMKTYLTMKADLDQVKKYENYVYTNMNLDGVSREMTTSSTFYYDHNKLIKVEEYMIDGGNKKVMDWYYSEDKPLYYTFKSAKAEDRAKLLLIISDAMFKKIKK